MRSALEPAARGGRDDGIALRRRGDGCTSWPRGKTWTDSRPPSDLPVSARSLADRCAVRGSLTGVPDWGHPPQWSDTQGGTVGVLGGCPTSAPRWMPPSVVAGGCPPQWSDVPLSGRPPQWSDAQGGTVGVPGGCPRAARWVSPVDVPLQCPRWMLQCPGGCRRWMSPILAFSSSCV